MKKNTLFFILLLILISALIYSLFANSTKAQIKDRYAIDVSALEIIYEDDTHGGFFGDGVRYVIFDCGEAEGFENEISSWRDLPLTDNLQLLLYGGERDGITYGFYYSDNYEIPVITDGKYYFTDRLNGINTDIDVFSRPSLNFTVFMYDKINLKLYMLEVDT